MEKTGMQNIPDFFESSRDCIFLFDKNGVVMDINPNGHKKLGYAKNEIVGKNIAQIVPGEFSKAYSEILAKVIQDKKGIFESTLEHKNGEKIPVEIHGYAIAYKDTEAVFAMHHDIRLRKEIKNMLNTNKNFYNQVFAACPDGVLILSKDGKILDVNEAYLNRSGYTREDLANTNFFDLVTEEHRLENAAHMQKVIVDGSSSFDGSHKIKDGQVWSTRISVGYDEVRNRFIVAFMDNKKSLEQLIEDLSQTRKDIQKYINSINAGVILGKPDGTINFVNSEFAKMLDYTLNELLSLSTRDIIYPEDFRQKKQDDVYDGKIKEVWYKGRVIRKNGELLWIEGSGSLFIDSSGEKFLIGQYEKASESNLAPQTA